jgi:hypothetical protein
MPFLNNDNNTFTSPVVFDNDLLYKIIFLSKFTANNRVIIFKADVPLPQEYVTIEDFGYNDYAFYLPAPKDF